MAKMAKEKKMSMIQKPLTVGYCVQLRMTQESALIML